MTDPLDLGPRRRWHLAALLPVLVLLVAFLATVLVDPASTRHDAETPARAATAEATGDAAADTAGKTADGAEPWSGPHVVGISVDGLSSEALETLGRRGAPAIWRLVDEGASTLDARTAYEQTVTLPNHTGMVTGRRIDAAEGGHGVTFNDDVAGPTVPDGPDGAPIASIFTDVTEAGGTTAVFSGKVKFDIFRLTWPDAVGESVIDPVMGRLGRLAARDLHSEGRAFTFVHLADADLTGHRRGWGSPAYLAAVRRADEVVGRLLRTIEADGDLARTTTVVLTADHGGTGPGHSDPADPANYTIPFTVWGPTVPAGDLYDLSPGLQDPGDGRPTYDGPQPVRNCDLAGVAAAVLRIPPLPGATCRAAAEMGDVLG